MNIFPKQRNFINRKAIFFFATQNKNETVALNTKDKISRGYINDELSRTDNIANNASNVNNAVCCFVYVNKHTNEIQSIDVLYAVNAKKEPAGSLSPEVSTPPTGSTISISNLLDCVNNCFLVM